MLCVQPVCWRRVSISRSLSFVMLREQLLSWLSSAGGGTRTGTVPALGREVQAGIGPFHLFPVSSDSLLTHVSNGSYVGLVIMGTSPDATCWNRYPDSLQKLSVQPQWQFTKAWKHEHFHLPRMKIFSWCLGWWSIFWTLGDAANHKHRWEVWNSSCPRTEQLDVDPAVFVGREDSRKDMEEICRVRIGLEKEDREKLFSLLAQELQGIK